MVWVRVCCVLCVVMAWGCGSETSESPAEDTGAQDTGAQDTGAQDTSADTSTDAPVVGDCPKTRADGSMGLEVCDVGEICCEEAVEGRFLGCADLTSVESCGACGSRCGDGEVCLDGQCTCGVLAHPRPDGFGPVCDTSVDPATGQAKEACCYSPNGRQECRPADACDCGGVQCVGLQICCYNQNFDFETCVDPTKDGNNCGGCGLDRGQGFPNPQFSCNPGEVCVRNFDYSLNIDPVEQNASGIFIGECALNCATNRAQCPGGVNPVTGEPYTQDEQSCVDPASSVEFCGAVLRANPTDTTTGRCSESDPQTFGQLKNFQGVRCGSGESCRVKLLCSNPEPFPGTDGAGQPCSPRTHYYVDVSLDPNNPDYANNLPLPAGAVFTISDTSTQAERDAYIENMYLRAVCDTTCRADQLRCVVGGNASVCVDPDTNTAFCGAPLAGDCTDDGVTDNDGVDCNRDLPNVVSADCVDGECVNFTCAPGFGNCDGDMSNGCEVDLSTDRSHCGVCSTAVVSAACDTTLAGVQSATCEAGQCVVTCQAGLSNCQGAAACSPAQASCVSGATVDNLTPGVPSRSGCETNAATCP